MTEPSSNSRQGTLSRNLGRFVEHPWFTRFITIIILLNAVGLGLETSPEVMSRWGTQIVAFDKLALGIYCVELNLKLIAWRAAFFRSGWNWFDLIIVTIALIPASGPLAVLRAFRVLRVLRLFSVVPRLRSVVDALLSALPGMGSVVVVMGLVFYVAAVIATKLFAADFPEWFGSVGRSMYSLFQVMTLESWSMGIVRPVMKVHPWAWVFFVPFIIVTSFAVLNLFIALLVNCMQSQQEAERHAEAAAIKEAAHLDAIALREELAALRRLVEARMGPENSPAQDSCKPTAGS
jgi:voltage-gated sodium channel